MPKIIVQLSCCSKERSSIDIELKVRPKTTIARLRRVVEETIARTPTCPLGVVTDWGINPDWVTCASLLTQMPAATTTTITLLVEGLVATEQQRAERLALANKEAQRSISDLVQATKERLLALHSAKPLKSLWAALTDPQYAVPGDVALPMAIVNDRHCGIECSMEARGGGRGFLRRRLPRKSFSDVTPLVLASLAGRLDVMKALIASGATLMEAVSHRHITPLLAAVAIKNAAAIELLVSHGAVIHVSQSVIYRGSGRDPLAVDREHNTLLHIAAQSEGCTGDLIRLLIAKGISVDFENNNYQTPLTFAARHKTTTVVLEALIECGASVNFDTPVVDAVGNVAALEMLLSTGAETEPNKTISVPIVHAASLGYVQIVSMLIANGANVNSKSFCGTSGSYQNYDHRTHYTTALSEAARRGHTAVFEILISHNANVNPTCGQRESALHVATGVREVELLLEAGADVNSLDLNLNTPLHVCHDWRIVRGDASARAKIMDLLLANGTFQKAFRIGRDL